MGKLSILNLKLIHRKRIFTMLFLFLLVRTQISFGQDSLLYQPVSLNLQNITVEQALDSIATRTTSYFTYNSDLFKSYPKVNVEAENQPLVQVLRKIIPDTLLYFQVVKKQIIIARVQNKDPEISDVHLPSKIEIKGTVTDYSSEEPLPYASIAILGKYKGTITNQEGEFELTVLPENYRDTLIISYIGYGNIHVPIPENKDTVLTVKLKERRVSLQEILIRNTEPTSLIKASLEKIEQNYHQSPMIFTSFYRESVLKNKKYMIYLESVLDVYKASIKKSSRPDLAKVIKSRKIYDVNRLDTVSFRLQGGVDACLSLDIVKNLPDFLDEENFSWFRYYFADILFFDNQPVYVIDFEPRPELDYPNFEGRIYIDVHSLAIVRAEFGYPEERADELTRHFIQKRSKKTKVKSQKIEYVVSYRKINDKYYLNHTMGNLKFLVRNKRKLFARVFESSFEMAFTRWDTTGVKRFKYREALHPKTILSKEQLHYDPNFWGNQTFISPEEDIQKALKRIHHSMQQLVQEEVFEE